MPRQPNFYCFFYCAAWDRPLGAGTQRHETGSQPHAMGSRRGLSRHSDRAPYHPGGRSSGSRGVWSKVQRQIPAGRRGIAGLVRCSMSPHGSIRRGR